MTTVWPDYFEKFHCIANRCEHTCCEGWEIDIDEQTEQLYRNLKGNFGDELRHSMEDDLEGDTHFILTENEKCPFLQSDGLCRLILTIGEENLCDICREHPRYYNYYGNVEESGVGMCCEEAVRLLLSNHSPVSYVMQRDAEEDDFTFPEPEIVCQKIRILKIFSDPQFSFLEKISVCEDICNLKVEDISVLSVLPLFRNMEIMNPCWSAYLQRLNQLKGYALENIPDDWVTERLMEYFVYRHFREGAHSAAEIFGFCLISVLVIRALDLIDADLNEHIRLYSSEIEYCEDNMNILMDLFAVKE